MKAAWYALILSGIAAALLLLAGPGARMEWWDFRTGFALMRWAVYLGLAGVAVSAVLLLIPRTRHSGPLLLCIALLIAVVTVAVPLAGVRKAKSVPAIHDISTDTQNPPEFVAILPLRADAPNPAAYGGPEIAASQREAYPKLGTVSLDAPPDEVFANALATARDMGWEIVAADAETGRIEATDTTFWFGFKDDIVIRVEPVATGSQLDLRSVSRVGKSDVGANAARIHAFQDRFAQAQN